MSKFVRFILTTVILTFMAVMIASFAWGLARVLLLIFSLFVMGHTPQ